MHLNEISKVDSQEVVKAVSLKSMQIVIEA